MADLGECRGVATSFGRKILPQKNIFWLFLGLHPLSQPNK